MFRIPKLTIYLINVLLIIYIPLGEVLGQTGITKLEYSISQTLELIDNKKYEEALEILLPLNSIDIDNYSDAKDPETKKLFERAQVWIKYHTGKCYLEIRNSEYKALPYLAEYIEKAEFDVDTLLYKEIGDLYYLNYQYYHAVEYYNNYLQLTNNAGKYSNHCQRMINICKNTPPIHNFDTLEYTIENLGIKINTRNSEITPMISSDDSILYYNSVKYNKISEQTIDTVNRIYVSIKSNGIWSSPNEILFEEQYNIKNISLAGLSPDGKQVYFCLQKDNEKHPYSCRIQQNEKNGLTRMNVNIEPKYWGGYLSMTADENEIYFSSSKPEGYGGYDIYKVVRDNNDWSQPINLGNQINTPDNETAPFIQPTKEFLVFSSDGYNTYGGYDIFKSLYKNKQWGTVKNLGIPINNEKNNLFFTLSASGRIGYFSASTYDKNDTHNIYKVDYHKDIPLTLLKGKILAGNPLRPVNAKITVIDNKTQEPLQYPYTPDAISGEYLMIFPPAGTYDIVFEAEGYVPHRISIKPPNQKYFFQLEQEVHLKSKTIFDNTIHEEINVRNIFYDLLGNNNSNNNELVELITKIAKNYKIITAEHKKTIFRLTDYNRDNLLNNKPFGSLYNEYSAIKDKGDAETYNIFSESYASFFDEIFHQSFCYPLNRVNNFLYPFRIANDTLYTAPCLKAYGYKPLLKLIPPALSQRIIQNREEKNKQEPTVNPTYFMSHNIYFKMNDDRFQKNEENLLEIIELLQHEGIGCEIHGYRNMKEDRSVAQSRKNAVLKHLRTNNIDCDHSKVSASEKTKDYIEELEKTQRVEIKLFNKVNL